MTDSHTDTEKTAVAPTAVSSSHDQQEPTYMEELNKKKEELEKLEKQVDEKMQKVKREADAIARMGTGLAGRAPPLPKTEAQESAERVKAAFKPLGLDPTEGPGAEAFK